MKTFFAIIKFVLTVLLAPAVWASGVALYEYVHVMPGAYELFFFWGIFGFLLIYLFLFQFWSVFEFGQKIVAGLFQFITPVNQFVAKIIPFYVTVLMLLFCFVKRFLGADQYDHYFLFFAGFTMTMHLILTAQDMQQEEKVFIKPNYLLTMACSALCVIGIVVLLFNLVLKEWTFPDFASTVVNNTLDVYSLVVDKLTNLG